MFLILFALGLSASENLGYESPSILAFSEARSERFVASVLLNDTEKTCCGEYLSSRLSVAFSPVSKESYRINTGFQVVYDYAGSSYRPYISGEMIFDKSYLELGMLFPDSTEYETDGLYLRFSSSGRNYFAADVQAIRYSGEVGYRMSAYFGRRISR